MGNLGYLDEGVGRGDGMGWGRLRWGNGMDNWGVGLG